MICCGQRFHGQANCEDGTFVLLCPNPTTRRYYFGEDVNEYQNGKRIVGHSGAGYYGVEDDFLGPD